MRTELVDVPHVVVGTPEQVHTALSTAERDGRLVTPPEEIRISRVGPDRVRTEVVIREYRPIRSSERPVQRRRVQVGQILTGVGISLALGALGGAVALIIAAVQWVIEHWLIIMGALIVAAGLALGVLATRTGSNGARHCPGVHD